MKQARAPTAPSAAAGRPRPLLSRASLAAAVDGAAQRRRLRRRPPVAVSAAAPDGGSGNNTTNNTTNTNTNNATAPPLGDWWRRASTSASSAADAAAALARPSAPAPPKLPPPSPGPHPPSPRHALRTPTPTPHQHQNASHRNSNSLLDVRQVSLFELFDGEAFTFTVPVYQRPYSWRHKQVFELLHDLEAAYNGGREYFLGAIVTTRGGEGGEEEEDQEEEEDGAEERGGMGSGVGRGHRASSSSSASDASYQVIDGQQRLTTLVMLLAYLRDWAQRRANTAAGDGEDPAAAAALAARLRRMLHIDADPLDPSSRPRYRLQLRPADQRFFRDNVLESFLPFRYHLAPTLAAAAGADADAAAAELDAADAAADAVVGSAAAASGGGVAGAVAAARGRRGAAASGGAAGGSSKKRRGGTARQTAAADDAVVAAAAQQQPQPTSFPLASETSWSLYSAARYLAAQLDSAAARGLDVPRFVAHVMRGCYVVVLTARDEQASFRIFSTLNGRGVDLSPVDKLKADLLRAVGGGGGGDGGSAGGGGGGRGGPAQHQQQKDEAAAEAAAARRAAYAGRWQAAESALGRAAFHRLFDHIRTVEEAAMAYGGAAAAAAEGGAGGNSNSKAGGGGSLFVPLFDLGALFRAGNGGNGNGSPTKKGNGKGSAAAAAAAAAVAATAPSSSFLPLGLAAQQARQQQQQASDAAAAAANAAASTALLAAPPVPSSGPGAAGMLDHFAPRTSDSEAAAELLDVLLEYAHRALLIRQNDWASLEAEGGSGPLVAAELRDACFFAGALRDDAWTPWCLEFWHQVDDDRKRAAFLRGAERLQLYCDLREGQEGPGYRHARWAAVGAELLARPFYSDRVLGALALTADERADFLVRLASRDLASEADERTLAHLLLRAEWGCRFAAGGGAPGGGAAAAQAAAEADSRAQERRRRADWRRLRVERVLPQHPPEGSTWRRVRLQVADEREVKYWGYEVLRANWQARLGNLVLLQPTGVGVGVGVGSGAAGGAFLPPSSSDFAAKSQYYRACGGGDPLMFPEFTGGVCQQQQQQQQQEEQKTDGGEGEGEGAAAATSACFSRDAFSPDECRARHAALLARLADVFELVGNGAVY
jgi:hypothetical protein